MEKAKTGHRPAGESRSESLGCVLAVEQTRITQEMDVDEHEEDKQAEPAADPHSQMFVHWESKCITFKALPVNSRLLGAVSNSSPIILFTRGVKGFYGVKENLLAFRLCLANGLQQV